MLLFGFFDKASFDELLLVVVLSLVFVGFVLVFVLYTCCYLGVGIFKFISKAYCPSQFNSFVDCSYDCICGSGQFYGFLSSFISEGFPKLADFLCSLSGDWCLVIFVLFMVVDTLFGLFFMCLVVIDRFGWGSVLLLFLGFILFSIGIFSVVTVLLSTGGEGIVSGIAVAGAAIGLGIIFYAFGGGSGGDGGGDNRWWRLIRRLMNVAENQDQDVAENQDQDVAEIRDENNNIDYVRMREIAIFGPAPPPVIHWWTPLAYYGSRMGLLFASGYAIYKFFVCVLFFLATYLTYKSIGDLHDLRNRRNRRNR